MFTKECLVNEILHNDENSTDEEILDLFIKHGLSQVEAVTALKHRPQCFMNMFHKAQILE